MKKILIVIILFYSLSAFAQEKAKNHQFHDEFISLEYFLDSK